MALCRKQAASPVSSDRIGARIQLSYSLVDPHLASTRPGLLRIGMPAEERKEWDSLWSEVKSTLAEARKSDPMSEK